MLKMSLNLTVKSQSEKNAVWFSASSLFWPFYLLSVSLRFYDLIRFFIFLYFVCDYNIK